MDKTKEALARDGVQRPSSPPLIRNLNASGIAGGRAVSNEPVELSRLQNSEV